MALTGPSDKLRSAWMHASWWGRPLSGCAKIRSAISSGTPDLTSSTLSSEAERERSTSVCREVCVYVCVYARACQCVCKHETKHTHECIQLKTHTHMPNKGVGGAQEILGSSLMYVCMYTCMYVHTHTNTLGFGGARHVCMQMYVYSTMQSQESVVVRGTYVCTYTCMYECMQTHTHTLT